MASRGRGAIIKGANFERQLAQLIASATGLDAHRGLGQTRGGGTEIADVEIPLLHIEAKRHKICNIKRALDQAIADSEDKDKFPVAITKDDRKPILCTMLLEDWLQLFSAYIKFNH